MTAVIVSGDWVEEDDENNNDCFVGAVCGDRGGWCWYSRPGGVVVDYWQMRRVGEGVLRQRVHGAMSRELVDDGCVMSRSVASRPYEIDCRLSGVSCGIGIPG